MRDVVAGVAAAADEPIAGGRHKVFGRHEIAVIPQTSTIASHLPRAVGVAFAIERARKLGVASAWPSDAIAVASAGDASMNHSTAVGAVNTACWCTFAGLPIPLLIVCEDNGIGISVRTPSGWIRAAYGNRPGSRVLLRRRHRSGRRVRRHHRGGGSRAAQAISRLPAPVDRAFLRSRRLRCRVGLPLPRRDRGGRGARPAHWCRPATGRDRGRQLPRIW